MGFTHLHVHTQYSLLDGACTINKLVNRVKELGQTSLAITDHGVMYGAVEFYKACISENIKPIIGCEVYVAARNIDNKVYEFDRNNYHLVLLAKNNYGYRNLIQLVSKAWTDGFYAKPRVDHDLLRKYSGGLICLSACLAGEIPQALLNGNYDGAKKQALDYLNMFGEGNFYIEIQNHGLSEQIQILPQLIRLSHETGIPLVATNDAHYIRKEDAQIQRVLMCIQTAKTLDDPNQLGFETDEFYIKSEKEMLADFPNCHEAISITEKIADMCNVTFEFGKTKLPHFEVPNGEDHFEYFKRQCEEGIIRRYGKNPDNSIWDRLYYELDIINRMGYVDYYLIVHDFIRAAKEMNIPVGPGRGSGAGSIAAYAIGITGLDPVKYNLLFERFLNPERISMPDFDVDFCFERRQEVIDYVISKYGADHVAQIVTFGTMLARGSIRDVGRVLGMNYSDVDVIAKAVPNELNMTIDKALSASSQLKKMYEENASIKQLVDISKEIEGMPRNASMHAAGVVITRDTVVSYVPLAKSGDSVVTQFTMTTLEELGLLKMDFLGLRTLTVIDDCVRSVRKKGINIDIETIKQDDEKVCAMLSTGETEGVFQFESEGMKRVLSQLHPESIEDLIAVISLYRPGPMDSIQKYITNKHDPSHIIYKAPQLKDILDVTYGCIVYQEQVMQIVQHLAGYSLGRADLVRRAMSKKKATVMNEERQSFVYGKKSADGIIEVPGAISNGISENDANSIFDEMVSFAAYAFNKSHAACYALVSYRTAYLKYYYPSEFMASLLTSVIDKTDKTVEYINECIRMGIKILPPDVNTSTERFVVEDGNIRFSLAAVKNLGKGIIRSIVAEREANGAFKDFTDFCSRIYCEDTNKRVFESLIKCGACDGLYHNRKSMLIGYTGILDSIDAVNKRNIFGQMSLFDNTDSSLNNQMLRQLPRVDDFTISERLSMEKESTGFYISGHPISEYTSAFFQNRCIKLSCVMSDDDGKAEANDGRYINALVIVTAKRLKTTKNNTLMAFVTVEDDTASCEILVFPRILERFDSIITVDEVLLIRAKVSTEDNSVKLIADTFTKVSANHEAPYCKSDNNASPKQNIADGLYLKLTSKENNSYFIAKKLVDLFKGEYPVLLRFEDTGAAERLSCSGVDINKVLLRELRSILGTNNVIAVINGEHY